MRHRIRYDTPNEHGETRRQRAARFKQPPPPAVKFDDDAEYLWLWFWDLAGGRQHYEGGPQALSFEAMAAWVKITGNIVRVEEWAVIRRMDEAYLTETAIERAAAIERMTQK